MKYIASYSLNICILYHLLVMQHKAITKINSKISFKSLQLKLVQLGSMEASENI